MVKTAPCDLRWFVSFALRTIFASFARVHERVRVQNAGDFSQTKLDSEINAPFLLNEQGDPHFLFYKFNENNILNNWEKKLAEIYGYFLGKWNYVSLKVAQ